MENRTLELIIQHIINGNAGIKEIRKDNYKFLITKDDITIDGDIGKKELREKSLSGNSWFLYDVIINFYKCNTKVYTIQDGVNITETGVKNEYKTLIEELYTACQNNVPKSETPLEYINNVLEKDF